MAFHAIKAGEGDVFVSAGVETVSRFAKGTSDHWPDTHNPEFADAEARTEKTAEGGVDWHDPREDGSVPDIYIAMGQTAENVARLRGPRAAQELDEFGVRSQNLAEKAIADGFWAREITPVTTPDGTEVVKDDGPRAGVTLEAVSQLEPVFRPDGVVTAGNCCALNDGAAAVVIMSDTKAAELGVTPLARIVATGVSGLSPEIMGLGPVEATKRALANAGMSIGDIDLVEINEAFAAQVVPSYQDLGIDLDRLNVNGGAIAVGHPFGMTGARLQNTMLNSPGLARQDHRPDHDVRRRRPGHGADPRASLILARPVTGRRTRRTPGRGTRPGVLPPASTPGGRSPAVPRSRPRAGASCPRRAVASCRRPRGRRGPPPGRPMVRQRSLRAAGVGHAPARGRGPGGTGRTARAAAPLLGPARLRPARRHVVGQDVERWPSTSTGRPRPRATARRPPSTGASTYPATSLGVGRPEEPQHRRGPGRGGAGPAPPARASRGSGAAPAATCRARARGRPAAPTAGTAARRRGSPGTARHSAQVRLVRAGRSAAPDISPFDDRLARDVAHLAGDHVEGVEDRDPGLPSAAGTRRRSAWPRPPRSTARPPPRPTATSARR